MSSADACKVPAPPERPDFELGELTHRDIAEWFHVYSTRSHPDTQADTFAQGWGDTRFAPILAESGAPTHTYYVASTAQAAYMESVLHDVSLSPPGMFELATLACYHLVRLRLPPRLRFVSLHTPFLPRLGLTRAQLVDSPPACYRHTRRWAQAAYLQCPKAQALGYGSRRDDAARCLMLFRQRLPDPPFEVLQVEPLAIGTRRAELLALVRSLRLHEI